MRRFGLWYLVLSLSVLAGCATFGGRDAPDVRVVGLEPLPSEALELRFALKLRVQNPNEAAIAYDGVAVRLDLDGRGLASGVSDAKGEVPRFGEQILSIPISISAFNAVRQVLAGLGRAEQGNDNPVLTYALTGKLGRAAGAVGVMRFSDKGELDLSGE